MPVFYAGSALDDVTLVDDLDWLASFLVVASALGDEQHLASGMDVPIELRAGTIDRLCDSGIEGAVSDVEFLEPDVSRVVLAERQFTFWEERGCCLCLCPGDEEQAESECDDLKFSSHGMFP